MPRRKRVSVRRPSWLWRWHHLLSAFVIFFGLGAVIASMQYGIQKNSIAQAAVGGNIGGWIWADPAGWISTSSTQPGACAGPGSCGSYGLNVDPVTLEINGFAWSDTAGWICFGSSCGAVGGACASSPPPLVTGGPAGTLKAWIDPISVPAPAYVKVHGWADVCNLGDNGWISLNCEEATDAGGAGCPALGYKYGVVYMSGATNHGYFGSVTGASPDSYAWNGNSLGTGYGYFDFHQMYFSAVTENSVALCTDGRDNDLNGAIDCADPSCAVLPICLPEASCGAGAAACCSDGIDNNANGVKDCADASCAAVPICMSSSENPTRTNPTHPFVNVCGDGIDNDGNGLTDCADPICAPYSGCTIAQGTGITYPLTVSSTVSAGGGPGTTLITVPSCTDGIRNIGSPAADCADPACATDPVCVGAAPSGDVATLNPATDQALIDYLCQDGLDNGKANGFIDCLDASCQAKSTICGSFIQAKFGNVYAQQGITGAQAVPSHGSYCLNTSGAITNFSSDVGCSDTGAGSLALPSSGSSYQGTLGSLDVNGILNGRYGTVIPIISEAGIPAVLGGKVYYSNGDLILNAKTFSNGGIQRGNPATERGNGLLVVSGTLHINGNIGYLSEGLPQSIRNLSSFGVVVKKRADGSGGNIVIAPSVTSISGAYFAEASISTGTNSPSPDTPLQVFGLMATKQFQLQRVYPSSTVAAETFTQDGRAVANPPPGMQEIGKSLPVQKDAF